MRRPIAVFAAFALVSAPAAAQNPTTSVGSVKPLYEMGKNYLVRAAEQMPEADYGFKPTPEVRSFGQLIGHVANAHFMFCAMATGQESPNPRNLEELTAKAELVTALKESAEFCDQAYTMADAHAMDPVTVFGMPMNKLAVLVFNAVHDWEHYGNIVTYMRLKGMVPPSSQR